MLFVPNIVYNKTADRYVCRDAVFSSLTQNSYDRCPADRIFSTHGPKLICFIPEGDFNMKKAPITDSFRYAFAGLFATIRSERNMKIHCFMAVCVAIAGLIFRIQPYEWLVCITLFGLVMGLETVNTAIEAVVDLVTEEKRPLAKKAKDAAAGAVLIAAIMAAGAGLLIFVPKLFDLLF